MTATAISMPMIDAALRYRTAGLSVIATRNDKRPVMSWKNHQKSIASSEEIGDMFFDPDVAHGIGVICGAVSGNLECLDFDDKGSAWPSWAEMMEEDCPRLLSRLIVERSPSGGRHVIYRLAAGSVPVGGKLAQRVGDDRRPLCVIETRGEGQYFCAHPTPGYDLLHGDFLMMPAVTQDEHNVMIRLAASLDEMPIPEKRLFRPADERRAPGDTSRPGDDFN